MSHRLFFEHVGYLLYAVIAADGSPDVKEIKRVGHMLSEKVKARTTDAAPEESGEWLIAKIAFDKAVIEKRKPSVVLNEFKQFAASSNLRNSFNETCKGALELLVKAAESYKGVGAAESALQAEITPYLNALAHG
jgi:hypothetical protein